MKIGIPKENQDNRVAMVPATMKKIASDKVTFLVEKSAGSAASLSDAEFAETATITDRSTIFQTSDIIVTVNPLSDNELSAIKKGTLLISMFAPYADETIVGKLKDNGLQAVSMDMIPRSSLAQAMDILSSMAAVAGYKAVLMAASHLPRYFPMMITAAGSIRPAKVLVLGAGVAGLQAIATARRLGAMVEAFDVRKAAKEEVESLGAKFVEVAGAADDTSAGGYAVEQSEDFIKKQRAEVQNRASKADVIITTAQVRGRKAPILLPTETVDKMKAGSVVVDLASSTGGNCELSKDNEIVVYNGVKIIGNSALASDMPQDASTLFSNNILNFLKLIIKDGEMVLDMEHEIIKSALITG